MSTTNKSPVTPAAKSSKKKSAKKGSVFKGAVIHYPADESVLRQIYKSISAFRCTAAVRYMDKLNFDEEQKTRVIDGLLEDMKPNQNSV